MKGTETWSLNAKAVLVLFGHVAWPALSPLAALILGTFTLRQGTVFHGLLLLQSRHADGCLASGSMAAPGQWLRPQGGGKWLLSAAGAGGVGEPELVGAELLSWVLGQPRWRSRQFLGCSGFLQIRNTV